jgi:signal transduction histidine kinase
MKIRAKITLLFSLIVVLLLLIIFFTTYSLFETYRIEDYRARLSNKAESIINNIDDFDNIQKENYKINNLGRDGSLYDENIVLYNSLGEKTYNFSYYNIVKIDEQKKLLDKNTEDYFYSNNIAEIYYKKFAKNDKQYLIAISAFDKYGLDKLIYLKNVFVVIFISSCLLVLIIGWFYSGRILQPITNMINEVDSIGVGNLSMRLKESNNKDELNMLAKTFNNMLTRVDSAFKSQEMFVANASHELRTPLTSLTGQLEITLLKDRTSQEYKNTIESVLEDIKNLNSISNSLILLIQTDLKEKEFPQMPVRVDELLFQVEQEYKTKNILYQINILYETVPDDEKYMTISGEPLLMKTCFNNLIENACKFSKNHSVNVNLSFDDEFIFIRFTNQGILDDLTDVKLIFQPFFRTNSARSYAGHGLGLAIVSKIVGLHQGTVNLKSENGEVVFTVILKHA